MDDFWRYILTIALAVFGSTGFWAWLTARSNRKMEERLKKSAMSYCNTKLLVGLGHDRIISLAEKYIERGYITKDEYENLHDYLYLPYKMAGGNGTAKKAMNEVEKLPMRNN